MRTLLFIIVPLALIIAVGSVLLSLGGRASVFLIVILGVLTIVADYWRRQRRPCRPNAEICDVCGYDLRASTDRCPECNAPIPADLERRRRIRAELADARTKKLVRWWSDKLD